MLQGMTPEAYTLFSTMSRRSNFVGLLEALGVKRMAEVGVYRGDFFEVLMRAPGIESALAIDPWEQLPQKNLDMISPKKRVTGWNFELETMKKLRLDFESKWAQDPRVHVIQGLSVPVAATIADGALDFVYIDGWHDYANVCADIAAWYPKVRRGGVISGHDYNPRQGVYRAVQEFVITNGLQERFSFFARDAGNWMVLVP